MADKQNENQQIIQKHDNYTSSWEGGLIDLLYKCWAKHTRERDKQTKQKKICLKQNQTVSGKTQVDRIKQKMNFMELCNMYRGKLPGCPSWSIFIIDDHLNSVFLKFILL